MGSLFFPPDLSSMLGAVGPFVGLKVLETGTDPLQPLHGTSPEVVSENSG